MSSNYARAFFVFLVFVVQAHALEKRSSAPSSHQYAVGECKIFLNSLPGTQSVHPKAATPIEVTRSKKMGRWGGDLFLFTKPSEDLPWQSTHFSHEGSLQGDPNWFIATYGSDIAQFFSFQEISKTQMLAPSGNEAAKAVMKLNEALAAINSPFRVTTTFYDSLAERVSAHEYLTSYAVEGGLPIAFGFPSAVHDASYHLGIILMPENINQHSRAQTHYLLEFIDALNKHSHSKEESFQHNQFILMMEKLIDIDEGTANSFWALNVSAKAGGEGDLSQHGYLVKQLSKLVSGGLSPRDYLQALIEKHFEGDAEVQMLWSRFQVSHSRDADFYRSMSPETIDKACTEIARNREEIQRAIRSLEKPK